MENTTLRRGAIIVGSVAAIYLVNLAASHTIGFIAPVADAAAGYALGIITRHFWS